MIRTLLISPVLVCLLTSAYAQPDSLIHSGRQIQKAKILSDSGAYDLAIREIKRIDPRDTNYVRALADLADLYLSTKKYDEAIQTTREGLQKPSAFRSGMLVTQGMALSQQGEFDQAKAVFEAGTKEFPFYPAFLLHHGKMLYAAGKYAEAEKMFFEALTHSPFNAISHLYLGIISMRRGEKVRGMMAMGLYMAINNTNNSQLVILEKFVKNELMDEFQIAPSTRNPFARLDEIIRSQIAMEEGYSTRISINVGIVKQYHLLFDQLNLNPYPADDPWVQFYLPVYQNLKENNLHDAFVYHMLKSTSIKQVPEWTSQNEKTLARFYEVTNRSIKVWRERKLLPDFGYTVPVACWYGDDSKLEAIGNKNGQDERTGLWYFFFDNGVIEAKGLYDEHGNKKGRWQYFNESGFLTKNEDHETGLNERFTDEGKPWQKYYLRGGEVDGEVLIYFDCGALRERLFYQTGVRQGRGEIFALDGTVIERYVYQNDTLHGPNEEFFQSGKLRLKTNYVRGKTDGKYVRYHENGKLDAEGIYQAGDAIGNWRFYHDNGQLREEGTFKDDHPVGEFRYFDREGKLTEIKNFNDAGSPHGENLLFHEAILHNKIIHEDGRMVKTTYFDRKGNEVATYGAVNGMLTGKAHFPTGEVRSVFSLQDGKATGTWKYFGRSGNLESEHQYRDDQLHGKVTEYYASGTTKLVLHYENGKKQGTYTHYHSNEKISSVGWYQDNQPEQRWLGYHPNGELQSDEYYLRGNQLGKSYYYATDGKIFSADEAKDEKMLDLIFYNEQGEQCSVANGSNGSVEISATFQSGRVIQKIAISCGMFSGKNMMFFPDGKVFRSRSYRQGKLHGPFVRTGAFGERQLEGYYVDGNSEGTWTWYYPTGEKEVAGRYRQDERDSVWTYYFRTGHVSKTVPYKNGKRHGVSEVFGPEGSLILRRQYDEGDLIAYQLAIGPDQAWKSFSGNGRIQAFYADGKPALDETYKNGLLHGEVNLYYKNGKLYASEHFAFGDVEGVQMTFFPDGKIQSKSHYLLDNENGAVEWFDVTGKPERIEQYAHGYLNGVSTRFQQGKKVVENKFWYGVPTE